MLVVESAAPRSHSRQIRFGGNIGQMFCSWIETDDAILLTADVLIAG